MDLTCPHKRLVDLKLEFVAGKLRELPQDPSQWVSDARAQVVMPPDTSAVSRRTYASAIPRTSEKSRTTSRLPSSIEASALSEVSDQLGDEEMVHLTADAGVIERARDDEG